MLLTRPIQDSEDLTWAVSNTPMGSIEPTFKLETRELELNREYNHIMEIGVIFLLKLTLEIKRQQF